MQITSPSKISMSSPRNGQSPKSKLHRVISAQLRSIKKSQCQSQIVLINKNTKQPIKQQNYDHPQKQYQARQIQYVQLIKELHMQNKKLKQKLSMEQVKVNPINMSLKYEKKIVSPSMSPNMKMRLSPNNSFNKPINNQTHKRNFTVVNSSAIPLCSPIQVRHQNEKSGQYVRSPISLKSPIKNYTNVLQSVNCTPKRSFQTIQALNSQVFYGSNTKVNQNYSSPRVIENNSIVLQSQSFKKKEKNETVQYAKNYKNQAPIKQIIPHVNQAINQKTTFNNPNFVNKLHFSYSKKDEKNDNLQVVKTGTQMQKVENPLKILQKEFNKLPFNLKNQQNQAEKCQKNAQSQCIQKQQANHVAKQQGLKTNNLFDLNKNIQQNQTLNSLQKRIYEQFCGNAREDNEQNIQNSQSQKQKDTKTNKSIAQSQSQSSSQYQVSSGYNKNIRYSRNNHQESQIENSHQQLKQKQMTAFQRQKAELQQTQKNLQQKKSIKSIIQLVRMEQSRNDTKKNMGLSNLENLSQNQNQRQDQRERQRERQPQSIDNLLQQQKQKEQKSKIQEEIQQNKILSKEKEEQKVEVFHEVQNSLSLSLEQKQKMTQCYQYKLFYATASTPVQQKQNQFKTHSQSKQKQNTKNNCENKKGIHWRTPGVSQSKTDNNFYQCKFNRFGDSDVSMSSLRSKKYSRISNKAYL